MITEHAIAVEVGGYQLAIELKPTTDSGVLGVQSLSLRDAPALLGIGAAIPKTPLPRPIGEHCGQALTLGPAYKEADGFWVPLAGVPAEWCEVNVETIAESADVVELEIEYRIGGGPTLWEHYRLTADGLQYETRVQWIVGGFRLQMPMFVTDGRTVGICKLDGQRVTLTIGDKQMTVTTHEEDLHWQLEPLPYANHVGVYQNAFLQRRSAISFAAEIRIGD